MDTVDNKNLKWGVYTSPQCDEGVTFERYVIESIEDLNAYAEAFPIITKVGNVYNSMAESIAKGKTVIATDSHPLSGFPTWCYESPQGSTHPSSMLRIKLG